MTKKSGRIALKPEASEEPAVDGQKFEGAMSAMRDQAQEDLVELLDLAGDVKAIQMADVTIKFLRAAEIRLFQRIRESRKIKDLPIRTPDGLRRAESIEEFCPLVFGRSYSKMAEEQQNLELLGEESYELAGRLGLNRSALRAARALPPEKLEIVRAAIGNGSTKAEVLSVIEDLAEKVEQADAATAEAKAELEAERAINSKKQERIERLEREKHRIERMAPDEALEALMKEAAAITRDAMGAVRGNLRQALQALLHAGEERGQNDVFMAGLVGQVQAELNALREEFNLPDVSAAADQQLAAEVAEWSKA